MFAADFSNLSQIISAVCELIYEAALRCDTFALTILDEAFNIDEWDSMSIVKVAFEYPYKPTIEFVPNFSEFLTNIP